MTKTEIRSSFCHHFLTEYTSPMFHMPPITYDCHEPLCPDCFHAAQAQEDIRIALEHMCIDGGGAGSRGGRAEAAVVGPQGKSVAEQQQQWQLELHQAQQVELQQQSQILRQQKQQEDLQMALSRLHISTDSSSGPSQTPSDIVLTLQNLHITLAQPLHPTPSPPPSPRLPPIPLPEQKEDMTSPAALREQRDNICRSIGMILLPFAATSTLGCTTILPDGSFASWWYPWEVRAVGAYVRRRQKDLGETSVVERVEVLEMVRRVVGRYEKRFGRERGKDGLWD